MPSHDRFSALLVGVTISALVAFSCGSTAVFRCPKNQQDMFQGSTCTLAPEGACVVYLQKVVGSDGQTTWEHDMAPWKSGCDACSFLDGLVQTPVPGSELLIIGNGNTCEGALEKAMEYVSDGSGETMQIKLSQSSIIRLCTPEEIDHPAEVCTEEYAPLCACGSWTIAEGKREERCQISPNPCFGCAAVAEMKQNIANASAKNSFLGYLKPEATCKRI